MITTLITTEPAEEGTAIITASFADEDGDAVAPNVGTLTWTLTDRDGVVVNSRSAVAIASAASVTVVLSANDLDITTYGRYRVITFQGLYNSSLGNNLPIKIQGKFSIEAFVAVT
jgi:hypothetical protein